MYQDGKTGTVSFQGFKMPPNTTVFPVQPKTRRLEFIGDSDTVGYCAADHGNDDSTERRSENSYVTWHAQLARSLDAEEQVQAISGIGVLGACAGGRARGRVHGTRVRLGRGRFRWERMSGSVALRTN